MKLICWLINQNIKGGALVKQDIVLISPLTEQSAKICEALRCTGMDVSQSENVDSAKAELLQHSPAFLLLDIDLEGAKGFLRDTSRGVLSPPPYILAAAAFLSASECIAILDLGADAYINKPISADEIRAVIHAVLRRERRIARLHIGRLLPCFDYKDLSVDPLRRLVEMRGKTVDLTEKEFDILYLLAYHSGKVLTKEEIYESVWKKACISSATSVSGHVFSLRQKLGLDPKDKDYIQTVFGVGYRFARIG